MVDLRVWRAAPIILAADQRLYLRRLGGARNPSFQWLQSRLSAAQLSGMQIDGSALGVSEAGRLRYSVL